jgi:hypothetical protein
MKKLFRRLAGYVVTAYANRLYRKAVKIADKRHQDEKTMIYVISGYINPDDLVTCNRDEWRAMKKKAGIKDHIESLKAGCWYHTTDGIDRNGLPPIDKEARRLAFVRLLLKRAGLA